MRLSLPDLITAEQIDTIGEVRLAEVSGRLDAFALSTGTCTGPVRIVASPESAGELGTGYILVCRSTDPSWTPLFVNAAGIVLECGGSLSHGAVVAREMAKPAVVLPNATQLLRENQQVAIDANQGAVFLTQEAGEEQEAGSKEQEGTRNAKRETRNVNPADTRILWHDLPPVAGRRERFAARLAMARWFSGGCFSFWRFWFRRRGCGKCLSSCSTGFCGRFSAVWAG